MLDPKQPPRILASTPENLKKWLNQIASEYKADEIMIQSITSNHKARLKSHQLLADVLIDKL